MKRFLMMTAVVQTAFSLSALTEADFDANFRPPAAAFVTNGVAWIDGRNLPLEGKAFADTEMFYDRLPAAASNRVPKAVWFLQRHSAGMQFRFRTDSKKLRFRWSLTGRDLGADTMPSTGRSGLDVYRKTDGAWRYVDTARLWAVSDKKGTLHEAEVPWVPGAEAIVNLPNYNGVESFFLGVDAGAKVGPAAPRRSGVTKPVVFYGTSITQGGCASRPGNAWVNAAGRLADVPVVNLGFSGSGCMEDALCDLVGDIDASCYVLDTAWNMHGGLIRARWENFARKLHARRPEVPIVFAEPCRVNPCKHDMKQRGALVRGIYEKLKKEDPVSWRHLSLVTAEEQMPDDGEGTVDGIHPNDRGMAYVAEAFARAVTAALAKRGGVKPGADLQLVEARERAAAFGVMSPGALKERERRLKRELLDLELVPPRVDTHPDLAKHGFGNLGFAMNAGMAKTKGGRLVAVWHAGGDSEAAYLVGSWSDDGGKSWGDVRFAVGQREPLFRLGFGAVYRSVLVGNVWAAPDGSLRLYVYQGMNMFDNRGALFEIVCRDPDAAEPKWAPAKFLFFGSMHNKPIVLKDGTWLLPADFEYHEKHTDDPFPELDALRGCGVLASTDLGRTWTWRGTVRPEGEPHFAEHSVVERADGTLHMLLRTGTGLQESTSADGGFTWTKPVPPQQLRQSVSRLAYVRLRSGAMLAVKNGFTPEEIPGGTGVDKATLRGWTPRTRLAAFVSDDGGRTWTGGLPIDERPRTAYPDAFQAEDGTIYVTYDRGRHTATNELLFATFREEDVRAGRPVTPAASFRNVICPPKTRAGEAARRPANGNDVVLGTGGSRVIDFGEEGVAGYPVATLTDVKGPVRVRLAYATHPDGLGPKGDFWHETRANYMGDALWLPILPASTDRFDVFEAAGDGTWRAPLAQGLVRYVRVTMEAGAAAVAVRFANDGVFSEEPQVGAFACSDERVNGVWRASVRTCRLAAIPARTKPLTVSGVHTNATLGPTCAYLSDGAKRDRLVWSGDLWFAQRNMYAAFGADSPYLPGSIRMLGENRTPDGYVQACPFPESHGPLRAGDYGPFASDEFAAWFVPVLRDHVLHSGDLALAREQFPAVKALVAYLTRHTGADGIFEQRLETCKHSCGLAVGGTSLHHRSYMNVLNWKAYADAASLADWLGETSERDAWTALADRTAAAVRREFWDAEKGHLVLSREERRFGFEANALALAARFATDAEARRILPQLVRNWHGKFQALAVRGAFEYGEAEKAMSLVAAHNWYRYLDPAWKGTRTVQECANLCTKGWGDEAHPDACLAGVFTDYLLGVEPVEPGYRVFRVRPQPTKTVTSAKGRVATPHGFIDVEWHLEGGRPVVTVTNPPGTRARHF